MIRVRFRYTAARNAHPTIGAQRGACDVKRVALMLVRQVSRDKRSGRGKEETECKDTDFSVSYVKGSIK